MTKQAQKQALLKTEGESEGFIPFTSHLDQYTVKTVNGDLVQVLKLQGISYETADPKDIETSKKSRNNAYKNIAASNLSIWTHLVKRRACEFPKGEFKSEFTKNYNEKYKRKFIDEDMFINELYLSIVYRKEGSKAFSFADIFNKKGYQPDSEETYQTEKALKEINNIALELVSAFSNYEAERLGTYKKNNAVYSRVLEFFGFLVNGQYQPMPLTRTPARQVIPTARPFFAKNAYELQDIKFKKVGGVLAIKEYCDQTDPHMFDALLGLDFEMVLTQSFTFMKKQTAVNKLKVTINRMVNAGDLAISQIEDLWESLDDLTSNKFVMGDHHLSLNVLAESVRELDDNLSVAKTKLADSGCVIAREDLAMESAFWAQLPGNFKYRNRVSPITSLNFASLASFHSIPSGHIDGNAWGSAVTMFKTTSKSPYYFNWHLRDGGQPLGNMTVIGPSGTGKTVFLGHCVAQAEKLNCRTVFFDKDRGAEICIRAQGGHYVVLGGGRATGFNPLQMEPNFRNIKFMKDWVRKLVTGNGEEFTIEDRKEVNSAVDSLINNMPLESRRLEYLAQYMDVTKKGGVARRLEQWYGDGEKAWVFDNHADELNLNSSILGFDITALLDDHEVRTTVLMYLFHRIEDLIDGTRIGIWIDEGWKAISDQEFGEVIKDHEKTIRKKNGFIVFGSNDAADALKTEVGKVIINQSPTQVFMPNKKASREDYVDGWKLTEKEWTIIKTLPEKSRKFLIKHGENSVVVELNLAGFDEEMAVLSGTTDNVNLLEEIRDGVGNDVATWLPIFYEKRRSA